MRNAPVRICGQRCRRVARRCGIPRHCPHNSTDPESRLFRNNRTSPTWKRQESGQSLGPRKIVPNESDRAWVRGPRFDACIWKIGGASFEVGEVIAEHWEGEAPAEPHRWLPLPMCPPPSPVLLCVLRSSVFQNSSGRKKHRAAEITEKREEESADEQGTPSRCPVLRCKSLRRRAE